MLLYGAGWLLLPAADEDAPPRHSDAISTVAFAAVVLGVLLLVARSGSGPAT